MSERAAPFYCPYCGDEDLRPSEGLPGRGTAGLGERDVHGVWECRACTRVFKLSFVGLRVNVG
jgi:hypothetical protein